MQELNGWYPDLRPDMYTSKAGGGGGGDGGSCARWCDRIPCGPWPPRFAPPPPPPPPPLPRVAGGIRRAARCARPPHPASPARPGSNQSNSPGPSRAPSVSRPAGPPAARHLPRAQARRRRSLSGGRAVRGPYPPAPPRLLLRPSERTRRALRRCVQKGRIPDMRTCRRKKGELRAVAKSGCLHCVILTYNIVDILWSAILAG